MSFHCSLGSCQPNDLLYAKKINKYTDRKSSKTCQLWNTGIQWNDKAISNRVTPKSMPVSNQVQVIPWKKKENCEKLLKFSKKLVRGPLSKDYFVTHKVKNKCPCPNSKMCLTSRLKLDYQLYKVFFFVSYQSYHLTVSLHFLSVSLPSQSNKGKCQK